MQQPTMRVKLFTSFLILVLFIHVSSYKIGVGISDITGPTGLVFFFCLKKFLASGFMVMQLKNKLEMDYFSDYILEHT